VMHPRWPTGDSVSQCYFNAIHRAIVELSFARGN
jgi:hypothetical protein